jgi:hypothetical protein
VRRQRRRLALDLPTTRARKPVRLDRTRGGKCSFSPRECERCSNTLCATRAGGWVLMIAPRPPVATGVR